MSGKLVVCPTPIGNLEDVTLRVLSALREADVVACEDTRHTRVLLDRYGVSAPLVSYHEHNEDRRSAELVARMQKGDVVALVSDAGMPLVSDPGYVLVRAAVAAGLPVEVLPGPSAAIAALVAFESPRRVPASLEVLASVEPERRVAVARELTKAHEEVVRGTARELAVRYATEPPRGEVVLVVAPSQSASGDAELDVAADALAGLVEAGARPRPAAAIVSGLTGTSANAVYRAWTERRGAESGHTDGEG